MNQIAYTPTILRSNIRFGGPIFLVADLKDFPTDACTISWWANQPTRLFYGEYDTGSSFDSKLTQLDINLQSGGMEVSFGVNSFNFSGPAFPVLRGNESHYLALTLATTADGFSVNCYANAVLIGTQNVATLNGNNQPMRLLSRGSLYIGNGAPDRSQDGGFGDLDEALGKLSELHIFHSALSAEAINLDALGKQPDGAQAYLNLPLDDLHHDRRRGRWLNTVDPDSPAREFVRTDKNPVISFTRSFSNFPTAGRTIEFWVRCREDATGTLISYGDLSSSDRPNEGGQRWVLSNPTGLTLGSYGSGLNLGTGYWNHVAIVEDATARTTTMYLNGRTGETPPAPYVLDGVVVDQPLVLGGRLATDADDEVFSGEMVELRIWSRVRTTAEVAESARGITPDGDDPALVEYWALGASGIQEGGDPTNPVFVPVLQNDVAYPLLSSQATKQVLLVGPDSGGMHTLPYDNLTGGEFSLEQWVRTDTEGMLLRGVGVGDRVGFSLTRKGQTFVLAVADLDSGRAKEFVLDGTGMMLSEWHHLAIVVAKTGVSGYLDGQEAFTFPLTDPNGLPPLGDQFRLEFGSFDGAAPALTGSLAEIRFWNKPLIVGEIRHRMYHAATGDEAGLVGRWAFENALGRDSSGSGRHAFPVNRPTFGPLTDIDLEPMDSPYLVAQVSMLEDYEFTDAAVTARNSYRVDLTAYDENDRPLAGLDLSVGIQAEPGNPFTSASLLLESSGKTEAHSIGVGQPYVLTTNLMGVVSFAMPAEDLLAPVLRVSAAFMEQDHALLIFPDRQAHHKLGQVTEEELLTKKVVRESGGEPTAMLSEEYRDSAKSVAHAIRNFMGVATEKAPQSNTPVVRPTIDRLRETVTPPLRRSYENATASPHAYDRATDVISGYAVTAGQTTISRSLSVNKMSAWEFRKDDVGNYIVADYNMESARARSTGPAGNVTYGDDFTRLLLTAVDDRRRSIASTTTYADLLAAIDEQQPTRGIFDFFAAIRDAVSFVVDTVVQTYEDVKDKIRVAIVYITTAAGEVLAQAIHAVEQAVEAVKGVLVKAGTTVMGAINFVKELFNWGDILETQKFTEKLLRTTMDATLQNLGNLKVSTHSWVIGLKDSTDAWLDSMKSDAEQHKSAIKDREPAADRSNVKGSYVQNLIASHGQDATLENSVTGPDPQPGQDKLDNIHKDNREKVTRINDAINNLHLFADSDYSLRVIADRLLDLLKAIADDLFDLMAVGLDWMFDQLTALLAKVKSILEYRIDLPLVTRLYEKITDGSPLTLYSLSALLGAIPATLLYKLATGADKGPFYGEDLARYGSPTILKRETAVGGTLTEEQKAVIIARQKASLGLGGCFLGFTAISTIFNGVVIAKGAVAVPALKWITHVINHVFQLTQFPLGSSFVLADQTASSAAPALEESIWALQYFPLVLEGVSVTDGLGAKQAGFDKFSGIATTVFGGLHAILFISIFATEYKTVTGPKDDIALKLIGNLSSSIPELMSLLPPVNKLEVMILSNLVWEGMSIARYIIEANGIQVFSPR